MVLTMVTHLTATDPMDISAGVDIMVGVVMAGPEGVDTMVEEGTAGAAVDMVAADTDGAVVMVTTDIGISGV